MATDLKQVAIEAIAERSAATHIHVRSGLVSELTLAVADLVASMQPTDACYADIQDEFIAYSSCQKYANQNTPVNLSAAKILQLCQLRDGEPITPLPPSLTLEKPAPAGGPGKLAKDSEEAHAALAAKLAAENTDDTDTHLEE